MEDIVLTLSPESETQALAQTGEAQQTAEVKAEEPVPATLEMSNFTEEEQKMIEDFSEKIDITSTDTIMQYGAGAQKKIADFSDKTLDGIKTKDLGEAGDMIAKLVTELKGFDTDEEAKGLKGLFKKSGKSLTSLKAKYDTAEVNVSKIATQLEDYQIQLLKDITILDELYERNEQNKKELSMYILAGQKAVTKAREVELPALVAKAQETGSMEDSQKANDYANLINRFEKKLYDLETTRMIAIQMSPQIRLIQNNDTMMAEKIQSTIVNTIPLWKSQMVIALGLNHSKQAMDAEAAVDAMTNELLKKNAANLKQSTVEAAKASERSIVEIETLQYTNQSLIDTLDEVLKIQTEGREKRQSAEVELRRLENEVKNKLLEIKR